jgi:hypothetical protein
VWINMPASECGRMSVSSRRESTTVRHASCIRSGTRRGRSSEASRSSGSCASGRPLTWISA